MSRVRTWENGVLVSDEEVADPIATPVVLDKTAFRAYAVSQLGGSTTGMARFQQIMDAAAGASGAAKFCFTQYQDATTVVKADLDAFLEILVGAALVNGPTQAEHDAVIGNWPAA